jgi:hypothetical protein
LSIAIDLDYGTGWTHPDYIASELCKYLHPLIIAARDVLDVYVQYIKYRVDLFMGELRGWKKQECMLTYDFLYK